MKITKRQLSRIIRESIQAPGLEAPSPEYDRGYQDGFDSAPPARDATADYDIGYEDGEGDATLPEPELGAQDPAPTTGESAPPWFDSGYSKFQSDINDFLDTSGYEPGVWYFWENEDIIVALGGEQDAQEIASVLDVGAAQKRWSSPYMNPSVVELEDGNWAIKLNAQMTQDRL
jgi:hypothetical protein